MDFSIHSLSLFSLSILCNTALFFRTTFYEEAVVFTIRAFLDGDGREDLFLLVAFDALLDEDGEEIFLLVAFDRLLDEDGEEIFLLVAFDAL